MGSCYNSAVVDAPIEAVWQRIRNFHHMDWAQGVIESLETVGDVPGDQVGAKRLLNGVFHETLTELDDARHTFSYTIDDGPEPISKSSVADYVGRVQLFPVTDENKTLVVWTSTYETDDPDAVAEFCNPIYTALLAALKKQLPA